MDLVDEEEVSAEAVAVMMTSTTDVQVNVQSEEYVLLTGVKKMRN